jgi:hypothetical protein
MMGKSPVGIIQFYRMVLSCAAVAQYTAQRQQAWAQKVLTGNPTLPAYQDLFASATYEHTTSTDADKQKTLMACTPVDETKMQNNTCVLSAYSGLFALRGTHLRPQLPS